LPALGAFEELGFKHRGPPQSVGDTGEDDGEIGGAERAGEQGEAWGGGALLDRDGELPAVVDQFTDEADDAAEATGRIRADPGRIGVGGWGREFEGSLDDLFKIVR
jgi:hypothetical protein